MGNGRGIMAQPRVRLAVLPTPLQEAPRLRQRSWGRGRCPRILIKRDDLTGLAFGGNKARKLEFLVADAMQQGATRLITAGAAQSNHARMTAAAARLVGLEVSLVLTAPAAPPAPQGNLLLDRLLGADIHFIPTGTSEDTAMAELAETQRAAGERPYVIPVGGSNAIGTFGYVAATLEIVEQLQAMRFGPPAPLLRERLARDAGWAGAGAEDFSARPIRSTASPSAAAMRSSARVRCRSPMKPANCWAARSA